MNQQFNYWRIPRHANAFTRVNTDSALQRPMCKRTEAMLSQPATKLFFKTTEPRAAKRISDAIGEIEVERLKEPRSLRLFGSRKSYAMEIATEPLVMASEISGLEPLRGFIKQENRVVPVHFQFAKKHGRQPEFIERKLPEITPRPSPPRCREPLPQSNPNHRQQHRPYSRSPIHLPTSPPTNPKRRSCGMSPRGLNEFIIHLHYNGFRRTSHACERIGANAD